MPDYTGVAELARAVTSAWNGSTLDSLFKQHWPAADVGEFNVLDDGEAGAKQPFPYCIFTIPAAVPTIRMSGGSRENREVYDCPLEFIVYARRAGGRSAKELAAMLAAEIKKVFGGSSQAPVTLGGGEIIVKTNGDFGVRAGSDEWRWVVKYIVRLDLCVVTN